MSNPGTPALLNCAGTPARVTIHPPTPPVTRSRRRDEQLSTVPFIDSIPETDDSLRKKIKAQENELAELRRQIAKGEEARKLQEQHEEIQMLRHRLAQNEADQREAALREAASKESARMRLGGGLKILEDRVREVSRCGNSGRVVA